MMQNIAPANLILTRSNFDSEILLQSPTIWGQCVTDKFNCWPVLGRNLNRQVDNTRALRDFLSRHVDD